MHDRRTVLTALGLALPLGLGRAWSASPAPAGPAPVLSLRPFEQAVREAFEADGPDPSGEPAGAVGPFPARRVEVGHCDAVQAGLQGCYNDRPFAGFPAGHLRIVQTGSRPGPALQGVRLYVTTVVVAHTGGHTGLTPGRPLDFASLPPAPVLSPPVPSAAGEGGGAPR